MTTGGALTAPRGASLLFPQIPQGVHAQNWRSPSPSAKRLGRGRRGRGFVASIPRAGRRLLFRSRDTELSCCAIDEMPFRQTKRAPTAIGAREFTAIISLTTLIMRFANYTGIANVRNAFCCEPQEEIKWILWIPSTTPTKTQLPQVI